MPVEISDHRTVVVEAECFRAVTARRCHGGDPDTVDTVIVVGTQGNILREATGAVADPWLVHPEAKVPVIVGRTAYDFATGRELWTAGAGFAYAAVDCDDVLPDHWRTGWNARARRW